MRLPTDTRSCSPAYRTQSTTRSSISISSATSRRATLSGRDFRFILRLSQGVAAARDGLDVVFAPRCIGKPLAQLAYEYVNDLGSGLVHATIEMTAEHLLGDCAAFAQRQKFQHLVLFH